VKPLPEALSIARSMDLDLVEVAPDANPPVCKIMDFNRFKYETAQKAKESRRKTTSTSIKEMKYRPKIGTGDFDTKTRQVSRFLSEGHKVKITIMFRGREMSHPELGKRILDHVAETVGAVAKVEAEPKLDGRNMTMVLAPDRRATQAARSGGRDVRRGPADEMTPPAPTGETTTGPATTSPAGTSTAVTDPAATVPGSEPGTGPAEGHGVAAPPQAMASPPAAGHPATT